MNKKVKVSAGPFLDPMNLVRRFQGSLIHPDFKVLGDELAQLAYSEEAKDVTDKFRNIITVATAKDNVSDRLRQLDMDLAPPPTHPGFVQRQQHAYEGDYVSALNGMHALQLGGKEGSAHGRERTVDQPMPAYASSPFPPQRTSSKHAIGPYSPYTHGPGYFHEVTGKTQIPLPISPYIPLPANFHVNRSYYGANNLAPMTAYNNNQFGGFGNPGFAPSQPEEYTQPGQFGPYQMGFHPQPFMRFQSASGMNYMHGNIPYGNTPYGTMPYGYQHPGSGAQFR